MRQRTYHAVPYISSVREMLLRSAGEFRDKLALEDLNRTPLPRLTYAELGDAVLRFGAALRALGIAERAHVAILSENRVQWAVGYLTAMCFDLVAVPVDRNLPQREILNILHESDAEAVIFSEPFESMLLEHRGALPRLRRLISMDRENAADEIASMPAMLRSAERFPQADLPAIDTSDTSAIVFTSGSLGRAKGVELSQANLASNLMSMVSMVLITPADRFLSVLPIHHTYECTCGLLCPLYAGSSIHYARSLKTIAEDLRGVRPTILLAVPLLYDKLFKRIHKGIEEKRLTRVLVPPLVKTTNLLAAAGWKGAKKLVFREIHERFGGHLRLLIAGGAAPDPAVARGLREFGFAFIQGYGLTETSPILALNRIDEFKDDAAGIPLPGVELRILEPDQHGVGEILAKGPNVMKGYYKNEKATKDAFMEEWFRTGDLGYIDAEDFLHISGRKKNLILSKSGENVYPEEIEDMMNRCPCIMESLVYGEKDAKQGEIIAAQIVPDTESFLELANARGKAITPELIREEIDAEIRSLNKKLPPWKQIRKFTIREEEFQKTTTQKIKRYLTQPAAPSGNG